MTDKNSVALENIEVDLYGNDWGLLDTTWTNSHGDYSLPVETGFFYYIGFDDPANEFASGYLGFPLGFEHRKQWAHSMFVSTSDLTGRNVSLPHQPQVCGTVTNSQGHGIAGITVGIPSGYGTGTDYPTTTTDQDGAYCLEIYPAGTFQLYFQDPSGAYAYGFYSGQGFVYAQNIASTVTISETVPIASDIDVVLPLAVHIEGRVTNASGAGLPGITVQTSPNPTDHGAWYTGADGSYSAVVAPNADYTVAFSGSDVYRSGAWSSSGLVEPPGQPGIVDVHTMDRVGIDVVLPTWLSAPTSVWAIAGDRSATVSWLAPTEIGQSPLNGYSVTSSPDGRTCSTSGALYCTVSGLTNGVEYTFRVIASNGNGPGPASVDSNVVTPWGTVPGKPRNVRATTGDGTVAVSWDAPVGTGSVGSYTVASSPAGLTCTSAGSSCTVEGVTTGRQYAFTVTATNGVGTGLPSDPSNTVIAWGGVPGKPTGVSAIPGDGFVVVSWAAPVGSGPVNGYTVTSSPGGRSCIVMGGTSCGNIGIHQRHALYVLCRCLQRCGCQ